jgi:hypothetical protein
LSIVVAEPFVQPLNHSVILLKESDIFLSDTWRIALDFNLSMYYKVISTVKADIFSVEQQKLEFTSVSEFRQIETQLQIQECKLNYFYQFLSWLDRRRSILGVGGTILRTLFGTATLADLIKLIVSIPLKTTNSYFDLYRTVILSQPIASNKHVRYSYLYIDYTYFAIQHSKHDYLLFTETDYNRCYRGSVTICQSNVPVFSAQTKTCEMSLYFQTSAIYHLCRRQLIYNPQAPIFQKFWTVWAYYFSTPHSVTLQCRNISGQTSYNKLLFGAGLLHNTADCYISSEEIHVFTELHGRTQVKLEPSRLYLPARMPVVTKAEIQKPEEIMPTELQKLDDIHSRTSGHQRTFDVHSLLHLHQTSSCQDKQLHWHLIITASICVVTILGVIICYYRSYLHNKCYMIFKRNTVQDPNTSNPNPQQELQNTTRDTKHEPIASERNVIFASCSMQPTN